MNSNFIRINRYFFVVSGLFLMLVGPFMAFSSAAVAADSGRLIPPRPDFLSAKLEIISQKGSRHAFQVELARTIHQQRYGLMYIKTLEAGRGMLFEHKPPRPAIMWMKNTYVPLDMLFADTRGRVVYIYENAKPMSEKLIRTPMAVRYILEVPAGTVKRLELGIGDRFVF